MTPYKFQPAGESSSAEVFSGFARRGKGELYLRALLLNDGYKSMQPWPNVSVWTYHQRLQQFATTSTRVMSVSDGG
ncbi:transposase [Saccharothrix obliqua]|uniref:transposase n=1 Tax=Saccharothrix obliqua TaxID=2861747 RepID=UPI001C5D4A4B|nr:transposase [Saccharothrix obliqua]MBW4717322.1 transposase [Saccharothrix obliqua]